jgi:hypothetical protein
MMKTSSSFLPSYKRLIPFFAVILVPFGPVDELLKEKSSYQGFNSDDPILEVVDIQKIKLDNLPLCQSELKKLATYHPGLTADHMEQAFLPWTEEDLKAVEGCSRFPCDIKLNAQENARVAGQTPSLRKAEWQKVIQDRVALFLSNGTRQSYLYPGDPLNLWSRFKGMGFSIPVVKSKKSNLQVRRLKFSAEKMRPLRQVLDVHSEISPRSVKIWIQDVYTAHYFDSWGEWHQADCAQDGTLLLIQSLVVDFDLLRKTDIISSLAKGKMRSGFKRGGHQYLAQIRERLNLAQVKMEIKKPE